MFNAKTKTWLGIEPLRIVAAQLVQADDLDNRRRKLKRPHLRPLHTDNHRKHRK
jgi:hypothetical protein